MLRLAIRRGTAIIPARCSLLGPAVYASIAQHRRTFFGLGEIVGVLANPAETIRQLKESKELLTKAREETELRNEKKRIPKKHTFSKLPGFHGRENEQALLRKVLAGNPQMNVIFGATSVGKTALLRQVLAGDDFYVIKFDLRISGFADLRTLYLALCEQFKNLFEEMHDEEMEKLGITFKHLTLDLDEKEEKNPEFKVTVADIADLMETLQSCLLKYWEYDPKAKLEAKRAKGQNGNKSDDDQPKRTRKIDTQPDEPETTKSKERTAEPESEEDKKAKAEEDNLFKKRPIVFFVDEAHKLPALIDDQLSLKVFLDTLLVLTKQDRLCHVILSTSDSFFQHFLRSMNVGHHSQLMTIGDCTKTETRQYFKDEIMPTVPDELKSKVDFEEVYAAFGGKLSHISDYMSVWINKSGRSVTPFNSAIFTQAYTLLQFHLTHESFDTYSPLSTATAWSNPEDETQFSRKDLIYVMRKLIKEPYSLPYFELCRDIGTAQADGMIKTRVLDLRWTGTVSPEQDWIERVWSKDGVERPIVLPMTRIVRRAMEVVLGEIDAAEHGDKKSSAEREGEVVRGGGPLYRGDREA
ncbi:hypothetical protein FKW77_010692 [Venturia effusa]|uniref:ATPase domain-containing protein n=1 Tax=Venturia effusa TaxID=50376 RepID=A0A517KY72_9PEZI|nr:hypothetical protein FKW77_010692 [Venturia effusa]